MPSDHFRTLLVDASEAFAAGAARWIASRPELTLVGTARSGPEALRAVEDLRPDLVVIDAVLPGIDGYRVARYVKELQNPPRVVIATFMASEAARAEAYSAGVDGFVAKEEFAEEMDVLLHVLSKLERPERGRPR